MNQTKASPQATALLDAAINSTASGDSECQVNEFSTDDQQVFKALRDRAFEIIAYDVEEEDEAITHRFILKQRDSEFLLSADVIAANDECSTYTFARIAQDEAL